MLSNLYPHFVCGRHGCAAGTTHDWQPCARVGQPPLSHPATTRPVFCPQQGLNWEFAVINNHTPNAYVLPGGKVVVFSGLLEILSREDEVAAVLAHEVSHVLARHQVGRAFFWGGGGGGVFARYHSLTLN